MASETLKNRLYERNDDPSERKNYQITDQNGSGKEDLLVG